MGETLYEESLLDDLAENLPGAANQLTTSPSFFAKLMAPITNSLKMDREQMLAPRNMESTAITTRELEAVAME